MIHLKRSSSVYNTDHAMTVSKIKLKASTCIQWYGIEWPCVLTLSHTIREFKRRSMIKLKWNIVHTMIRPEVVIVVTMKRPLDIQSKFFDTFVTLGIELYNLQDTH